MKCCILVFCQFHLLSVMAEELEFCGAECHLSDVYGGALLAVCEWLCLLLSVVFLRAGLLCYVSVNSCRALPGPPLSPCAVYPRTTPQHSTAGRRTEAATTGLGSRDATSVLVGPLSLLRVEPVLLETDKRKTHRCNSF